MTASERGASEGRVVPSKTCPGTGREVGEEENQGKKKKEKAGLRGERPVMLVW